MVQVLLSHLRTGNKKKWFKKGVLSENKSRFTYRSKILELGNLYRWTHTSIIDKFLPKYSGSSFKYKFSIIILVISLYPNFRVKACKLAICFVIDSSLSYINCYYFILAAVKQVCSGDWTPILIHHWNPTRQSHVNEWLINLHLCRP